MAESGSGNACSGGSCATRIGRLKQVVADLTLDKQILRESLRKKW